MTDEHQELPWSAYAKPTLLSRVRGLVGGQPVVRFPPNQHFVMKPHVLRFLKDLETELGYSLDVGTYAGHSPPEGPTQAVDIHNRVNAAGWAQQDKICAFFMKNVRKYGGRYCIRRHQIWNVERAAEGWRNQSWTGDPTVDHDDHGHFTFYERAEVEPKPEPEPEPIPEEDVMALSFRYVYNGLDWVFDGPSGLFFNTGTAEELKAPNKCKVAEIGSVSKGFHDKYSGLARAKGWWNDDEEGGE